MTYKNNTKNWREITDDSGDVVLTYNGIHKNDVPEIVKLLNEEKSLGYIRTLERTIERIQDRKDELECE